jgi:hypothetical protein
MGSGIVKAEKLWGGRGKMAFIGGKMPEKIMGEGGLGRVYFGVGPEKIMGW